MLYEDYLQTQMTSMKDINLLLQRFARELGEKATLVVPFIEDINQIKNTILSKPWTKEQLEMIQKMPGMLMIEVDFSEFDPTQNKWAYFHFDVEEDSLKDIEKLLKKIAQIVKQGEKNLLEKVIDLQRKNTLMELNKAIELKPNIMGIEIDLKEGVKVMKELTKRAKNKME